MVTDGKTPLYLAAWSGKASVVEALLSAGADKDNARSDTTPLDAASANGHAHVVELLLRADAAKDKPTDEGETPLCAAAEGGHLAV